VFGGDLNSAQPAMPGLTHVGGHHVDHLFVAGGLAGGEMEVLDAGVLSDHAPLRARTSTAH
jgi:endonuclease/exonuclease/phosphatase family metal-dependent hydrolase